MVGMKNPGNSTEDILQVDSFPLSNDDFAHDDTQGIELTSPFTKSSGSSLEMLRNLFQGSEDGYLSVLLVVLGIHVCLHLIRFCISKDLTLVCVAG